MIRLGSLRLFPLVLRIRSTAQPSTTCGWHNVTRDTSGSLRSLASARRRVAAPHAAMIHQDSEGQPNALCLLPGELCVAKMAGVERCVPRATAH